jgi:hypothetical protein
MTNLKLHHIPIYDLRLLIGVTDNPKEMKKRLGKNFESMDLEDLNGLCSHSGSNFALMFNTYDLCHELIAHEVMHCTHRMMEFCNNQITKQSHEPHCYLQGYITGLVYQDMRKWRIKVNTVTNFKLKTGHFKHWK